MDSLFGVQLTSILAGLVLITIVILGTLAFIAIRNPLLVRLGLRNVTRRKTQTALIVIGLMLSTLIISAAFATGDTVGYSVTNTIYNDLGEADIVAVFDRDADAAEGRDGLDDSDVETIRELFADDPDVDAVTGILQTPVPALNPRARLSEPQALFVGVDDTADGFNALSSRSGERLLVADLSPDTAYVSEKLAEDVEIEVGDVVTVFVDNEPFDFTILGIVDDTAFTATTALFSDTGSPAGGLVTRIERVREILDDPTRIDLIVISATGGVRDTLDLIPALVDSLEAGALANDVPVSVIFDKEEGVTLAEQIGSIFVTFFLVFGLFSIAAGIMLIFLTFVMLAAERRSEMGMARAVGMKRLHLTEAFIAEGMTYNLGAALIGAMLGVAVAYALIAVMNSVFSDFGLSIAFNFNPIGFAIAYLLGVVITFATVAGASWRAANLNIVRAIRDIPEPEALRATNPSLPALGKAAVGALWYLLWIFVAVLAGAFLFFSFLFGLAAFGIPVLIAGAIVGAYVWGLRQIGRPRTTGRQAGFIVWWIAFSLIALLGFFLSRTKEWADRHRNSGGWAVVMLVIGALLTWWGGWVSGQAFAYTAGTTLVMLAVAMLAVYFGAPQRRTFSITSIVVLWYWLLPLPFSLLFDAGDGWTDPVDGVFGRIGIGPKDIEGNIEMFFVSGICITAASTLFVIFNADRLLGAVGRLQGILGGMTPAIRTAIAYPLAAKFRTGLTLAMFTLVVFSLVVMATLNHNFSQLFFGESAQGGFDVQVTANPNNRIGELRVALDEAGYDVEGNIAAVGTLTTAVVEAVPDNEPEDDFEPYALAGLDQEFLETAAFPLTTFAQGYANEREVLEALINDDTVALANETVLSRTQSQNFESSSDQFSIQGSITDFQETPWEPIPVTLRNTETGETRSVRIIGFVDPVIISGVVPQWFSLFTAESLVRDIANDDFGEVFFVNTTGRGKEAAIEVAAGIESTLLERGVQGESIAERVDEAAGQSTAFSNLFQGFMSLGLIVGIAALGVIAFRTVAERRQQIGMLRAIGYSRRLVATSFFLESSFIALTGVAMGIILGGALSYNLMTSPDFTNGSDIDFGFPYLRLLIIVGIAYVASALMTLIPARTASHVSVAEALRYE